jgi:ATP-dependent helicase HrpA
VPRYLKAAVMRLDKLREDAARDAELSQSMLPLAQQWQRRWVAAKGEPDAELIDFGWQLQELRVSLFAQGLRTPAPVSVKRLEKAWASLIAR